MQLCPPVDSLHTTFAKCPRDVLCGYLAHQGPYTVCPLDPLPGLGRAESAGRAALGPGGVPAPAS